METIKKDSFIRQVMESKNPIIRRLGAVPPIDGIDYEEIYTKELFLMFIKGYEITEMIIMNGKYRIFFERSGKIRAFEVEL